MEPDPSEWPYRGPQGCPFGIHLYSDGVPTFAQRQETVHPPEMPIPYPDVSGGGCPPEPSIKNIKAWLDWAAHQLDMPHWWVELTAISHVENPEKLARKIHASVLISAVRCEASPGQGYTIPPAPKCLTRNMFLPNNLSYQGIHWQPLLLTVAYTCVLQYWVEKFRPPVHPDYHPLVMSVVELMQHVKEHITFYKQDILWGLGTQPTATAMGSMESNSAEAWGHMMPLLTAQTSTQGDPPLVKLTVMSTMVNGRHILPSLADRLLEWDATVFSATPEEEAPEDRPAGQVINPIEMVAPLVSTMTSVDKLTSPIVPSDQTKEERWYVLVVTASVRRLNLEATGVILGDMVTTSARGVTFQDP